MKLALCQAPPTDGDEAAAFARIGRVLSAAACAGAEMAVMPELFLPGCNRPDLHAARAQPIRGGWEDRLCRLCRQAGCGLTLGWAERSGTAIFNAASVFERTGAKLAHDRKRQSFGPVGRAVFTLGDALVVFDLAGRRAGLLICYDAEFAPLVRRLADKGAALLLVPTANPAGYDLVPDALLPARAHEACLTIVYADYCGAENGLSYGGRSLNVGPDGAALGLAGRGEALIVVDMAAVDGLHPDRIGTQAADWRLLPPD